MGKSAKKSASKAEAAAIVAAPTKALKKGNREAEDAIGKEVVTAKKQKVEERKTDVKNAKKDVKKKVETSSEEETFSESAQQHKVKVPSTKNGHLGSETEDKSSGLVEDASVHKKMPSVTAKDGHIASKKKDKTGDSDSSSDDETSSDEDVATIKKALGAPTTEVPLTAANKKTESSDDSDSEDETSSDEDVAATKKGHAPPTKKGPMALKKDESSNDDSDSEDLASFDEDVAVPKKATTAPTKNGSVAALRKKDESCTDDECSDEDLNPAKSFPQAVTKKKAEYHEESESDDESSSDEQVPKAASLKRVASDMNQEKKADSQGDTEDDSSEEIGDGEPQKKKIKPSGPPSDAKSSSQAAEEDSSGGEETYDEDELEKIQGVKKDTDVEMNDVLTTKGNSRGGGSPIEKAPETHFTQREQTMGSKTLFVGNLSFSVEQADVENFCQAAGEIVDIRFAMNSDDSFRGFGYVEFASAEAADKALQELNGKELLGRPVRLDLARERGLYIPYSGGKDTQSFQKGRRTQGQTIFVRGFDKYDGEEQIRSSLEQHFGSCGEITRISIPRDQDGGFRGIAYIDFKDNDAFKQALEQNGSEFGASTLLVEEAKPRGDGRENTGGGRGGGRSGGRGARSGGRDFGSRFGGGTRGGGSGGRGGGGVRFGGSGRA